MQDSLSVHGIVSTIYNFRFGCSEAAVNDRSQLGGSGQEEYCREELRGSNIPVLAVTEEGQVVDLVDGADPQKQLCRGCCFESSERDGS